MVNGAEITDSMQELAWSLLGAVGVPSVIRKHDGEAVDPEALIAFTSTLGESDPRCREEALNWAVGNKRYLSRKRLELIRSRLPERAGRTTIEFMDAIWGSSRRGPATAEAHPRKQREADLKAPATIRLRARAVLGTSARTEALFVLTWERADWESAAGLASETGYTKRNVTDELDALVRSGYVEARVSGNRHLYRAARSEETARFLAPVPATFTNWAAILPALAHVSEVVTGLEGADTTIKAVEATSLLQRLREFNFSRELPQLPEPGPGSWESLIDWSTELLRRCPDRER